MSAPFDRAVRAIERRGILLVYPLANRPEPRSLWSELHPRSEMRWSWDSDADGRIAQLWRLREELARSHDVVYAKWFRGRATFFARPVFRALLARVAEAAGGDLRRGLSPRAGMLLELLEDNSPQSTKELRAAADLQGKPNEAAYTRGLRELWSRLVVVGVGEVDDGAFPSLLMSATRHRFEDLWPGALGADEEGDHDADEAKLQRTLDGAPLFANEVKKTLAAVGASKSKER